MTDSFNDVNNAYSKLLDKSHQTNKYKDGADNTTKQDVGPMKSMIFFFVISILYLILNIYNIISSNSIESVVENSNNNIFILAYVFILIIGMFFINLGISKNLCDNNSTNYNNVFFQTFLPWLIIFGIIYFILEIYSGWARPFSNTIGYFIVGFLGLEKVLKEMLNKDHDSSVKTAIEKIENNISEFINEFDVKHTYYVEFIKKLQAENITKSSTFDTNGISPNEIELFKLINIKHLIGKVVWYFLAGTVIAAISYNNIINQSCDTSIRETQAQLQAIQEAEEDEELPQ
tara:strand:+ start:3012 stop:3878 length:867 start_codon:yes stop_codon:yes gene_type:complete